MSMDLTIKRIEEMLAAATPGPWAWFGNKTVGRIYLASIHGGRKFAMTFERWGMRGATPRFYLNGKMQAPHEFSEADYNGDFQTVHPTADLVAAAPSLASLVLELAKALGDLQHRLDDHFGTPEHGDWKEQEAARALLSRLRGEAASESEVGE